MLLQRSETARKSGPALTCKGTPLPLTIGPCGLQVWGSGAELHTFRNRKAAVMAMKFVPSSWLQLAVHCL